jgi:hypothetical protein
MYMYIYNVYITFEVKKLKKKTLTPYRKQSLIHYQKNKEGNKSLMDQIL